MQMPCQFAQTRTNSGSALLCSALFLPSAVAPVCRAGQRTTYSSGRHETVKVACEIDANPAEATYVWKFNATQGETADIPASLVAVDRGRSIAHYTPMTENVSKGGHTHTHTHTMGSNKSVTRSAVPSRGVAHNFPNELRF